jgi:UPF0042 nucleotide-binding protein
MSEQVVLVTGMSGAGRTAALKALEDLGYEAVDNLPISLFAGVIDLPGRENLFEEARPLAVGIDLRTRDFAVDLLLEEIERLTADSRYTVTTIFIDCDDAVLVRRYTETRRRHPLGSDRPMPDTIRLERRLLTRLRDRADLVVDTTNTTPAQLKAELGRHFALEHSPGLGIFLTSFSFRYGVPREADIVFDVRFLNNPHYQDDLRDLTGEDQAVRDFIAGDPDTDAFLGHVKAMLGLCLPRYRQEGKSYLNVAIGCTGGRHRSVCIAILLAQWLESENWPVRLQHRDIHRHAGGDML